MRAREGKVQAGVSWAEAEPQNSTISSSVILSKTYSSLVIFGGASSFNDGTTQTARGLILFFGQRLAALSLVISFSSLAAPYYSMLTVDLPLALRFAGLRAPYRLWVGNHGGFTHFLDYDRSGLPHKIAVLVLA